MIKIKLIVLHGPPASGKSTWARKYVQENPNTVIVCREEICNMLGVSPGGPNELVDRIEATIVNLCLQSNKSVIVDSTRKLEWEFLLSDYLFDEPYDIQYIEFGKDLSTEELVTRDKQRGSKTGEEVIRKWKT